MQNIPFPEEYMHDHPPMRDVISAFGELKTLGDQAADLVVRVFGLGR